MRARPHPDGLRHAWHLQQDRKKQRHSAVTCTLKLSVGQGAMSVEALQCHSAMSAVRPMRTALVRTLRSFVKTTSCRGVQLGGVRLAGRPQHQQQGAFSSARIICQAASASATEQVQTEAPPAGGADAAAAAATGGNGGKPYQSNAYPFTDIEAKWQAHWEEHKTFRTPDIHELDTSKPKFYALDMFPYPRCGGQGGRSPARAEAAAVGGWAPAAAAASGDGLQQLLLLQGVGFSSTAAQQL